MIIDAHSHVHDPVEKHLALLDEASADKAILFATRPHPARAATLDELKGRWPCCRRAWPAAAKAGRGPARTGRRGRRAPGPVRRLRLGGPVAARG
ncbi:amidohodrolase [Amycolatopsis methanolica 239]|uniref:Amidohodrolase n=1 Tax=Amycolatopsis methanolica 239 TaxID=1068978 RepID=A0A076MJH8_AMYME|nr:amidohodrolase [Amycolatopsis methanolica 239]